MKRSSQRSGRAATLALAMAAAFPVALRRPERRTGRGQPPAPDPSKAAPPTVYSNPRAKADDPRIGLKGGLYDAAEAAWGMQQVATLAQAAWIFTRRQCHGEQRADDPEPPPDQPAAAAGGRGGRGAGRSVRLHQFRPGI